MRSVFISALCLLATLVAIAHASTLPNRAVAVEARSPGSPVLQARTPVPSLSSRHLKREQTRLSPVQELSQKLCPFDMSVCPIASGFSTPTPSSISEWISQGFECVDFKEDLTSCGGCGNVDIRHDCTAIPEAFGVSCVANACQIDSCKPGFTLSADGKACVE